jgi:hypothetical protein
VKRCGVCRATYRGAGRRVVADGRFRLACPRCAERAVRVVQSIVLPGCACGATASVCVGCARKAAEKVHSTALESSLQRLRAYLTAFKRTVPPEGERSYVEGVVDGLGRAIDVLLRRQG